MTVSIDSILKSRLESTRINRESVVNEIIYHEQALVKANQLLEDIDAEIAIIAGALEVTEA